MDSTPPPTRRATFVAWALAVLLLAVVVGVILRLGELEELVRLLRGLRPEWLLAGMALQAGTYVCAAGVWQLALAAQGQRFPVRALVPVALAMLFTNQAFPSAGLAGSVVVVRALGRRRVPGPIAMGALLVGLTTQYHASLVAIAVALPVLRARHEVDLRILAAAGTAGLAAVGVPALVLWLWRTRATTLLPWAVRAGRFASLQGLIASTPTDLLRDTRLWFRAVIVQVVEIGLDAATLHVMLLALGVPVPLTATFASYVMASAVARVVPVPLGLGSFEAAMVGMLRAVGVPLEAGLAATLLLRGLTMWLPMLPGLWFARRELRAGPAGLDDDAPSSSVSTRAPRATSRRRP